MRKNFQTWLISTVLFLGACSYMLEPFLPGIDVEKRGFGKPADIYKIYDQDKVILNLLSDIKDAYPDVSGFPSANWLLKNTNIYWFDTVCPYRDQYALVDKEGRCYHGVTFSCKEILVALSDKNTNRTCGSALAHEVGHCIHSLVASGDREHKDTKFWEVVNDSARESCDRGW